MPTQQRQLSSSTRASHLIALITLIMNLGCSVLVESQLGYTHQSSFSDQEHPVTPSRVGAGHLNLHFGLGGDDGNGVGPSIRVESNLNYLKWNLGGHIFHLWDNHQPLAYYMREAIYIQPLYYHPDSPISSSSLNPVVRFSLNPGVIYYPSKSSKFFTLSLDLAAQPIKTRLEPSYYSVGFSLGFGFGGVTTSRHIREKIKHKLRNYLPI